ncbi:hypothetical protein SAMN03159382_04276 [Pseudomonas sp. NFACC23-1]|uniref:hypothetical protein n=1 Tax=unclassified Pseudomonas TaxID=196821 RepID=UPI000881C00F|nr:MULTISPECIES: hypothetical protein [unclassified Pseudomonas]SDB56024.1 hypothetical protein SAMN03159386_04316 [Pseudomonas sp. NFACC17-2]SEJ77184.1 hypothetical protein SAMN03159382_04276 [Pseudomonas sp. NFACC23-1]SFW88879.1 hypothetical protein SAMN05660640_04857 [Pseudomonas sp. NFACC16-2]
MLHTIKLSMAALIILYQQLALADCTPDIDGKSSRLTRLNLNTEECRTIDPSPLALLEMTVEFPSAKVVPNAIGDRYMLFWLKEVDVGYSVIGSFEGLTPTREENGLFIYKRGGYTSLHFSGSDGESVAISQMGISWVARRMFHGLAVSYQYRATHTDFKAMDEFALEFLERIIID